MLKSSTVWLAFLLYLAFLLIVALTEHMRSRQKSARGFATAGGSIKWPILVMTYIASLMSTWVFFRRSRRILPGRYRILGIGTELHMPVPCHRSFCHEQGMDHKQHTEIHHPCRFLL